MGASGGGGGGSSGGGLRTALFSTFGAASVLLRRSLLKPPGSCAVAAPQHPASPEVPPSAPLPLPAAGPQLDVPHDVTPAQLETLLNGLLQVCTRILIYLVCYDLVLVYIQVVQLETLLNGLLQVRSTCC